MKGIKKDEENVENSSDRDLKNKEENVIAKERVRHLVPEDKILKIMEIIGVKQPKESSLLVQDVVERCIDDFIDRLIEIKKSDKKQKINEEDIKDLIIRDDIEYLKEILKE